MLSTTLPAKQPMDAATVVADHAAERAAAVRGRIGRVGEVIYLGGVAQRGQERCPAARGQVLASGSMESMLFM